MKLKSIAAYILLVALLATLILPTVTVEAVSKTTARTKVKTSLYKSASTKKKVKALPKNAKITITGERGKFYKAVYGKKKGYVLKSKVKLTPTPTPTPTGTPKPTQTPKPTPEPQTAKTICNICGQDITDNVPAHGDSHLLNGENFSYRVE